MNKVLSERAVEELAIRQLADYRAANPGTCFSDPNFNISASLSVKDCLSTPTNIS